MRGKTSPTSRNDKVCFRCNNKGHIAKYCRTDWNGPRSNFHEQRNTGRGIREPPICYRCGVAGHIATNCLSHSENSVRPRVLVKFARSNHDDRQAAKSEKQRNKRVQVYHLLS